MANYSLSKRTISFASPAGDNVLLPESFQGTEGLSRLFDFELELLAEAKTSIDPKSLVGQKATVGLQVIGASGQRYINGLIASFSRGDSDDSFDSYRVRIVPALWLLTLNSNCRIFQNKSVIDILKAVFQQYGLSLRDDTQGTYPALDYCTQYRETDFQFVSRLMEQNGIFYFFVHTADDHQLVMADGRNSYAACPLNSSLQYVPSMVSAQDLVDNLLHDLREESTMVAGKHTRWDYNFRNFASIKTDPVTSASDFGKVATNERYDYPGAGAAINAVADSPLNPLDTAQIHASAVAEDVSSNVFHGKSNSSSLTPGYTFDVTKHTNSAWNRKFLLTQVTHTASQSPSYRGEKEDRAEDYANTFIALKSDLVYRAAQTTPKPTIPGPQTGVVVGPSGEEIYLDKFGRIKVQFFWDRLGKDDENSSAWLRVAQQWAGKGWGTHFWPRVSDEVIISFFDGDPDHPIVVGSVYNGVNMPPYALPDNSTRSGILTHSSKGGSASTANELRFEDKMGSEQIYIHAEKDMDLSIENNSNVLVGKDENVHVKGKQLIAIDSDKSETIGGTHKEQITGDSNLSIGKDFNEQITGNYSLQTGQNQYNKVGQVYVVDSGQEVHIKGGMKVVIEAGLMGLSLVGPGGFISIDATGVSISGMLVKINSGGAQLQGTPASPTSPVSPDKPVDAENTSGAAAGAAPTASPLTPPAPPSLKSAETAAAGAASGVASQVQMVQSAAQSALSQGQSLLSQAESAAKAAAGQVQAAATQAENAAQAAVQQAQQAAQQVQNAAAQAEQAAQKALQQGSQFAQQVVAQAKGAIAQAQQQVQQAVSQAQQAAQQAQQQAQQAVQQAQQQVQQTVQQAQQQAQQVQQQAQQAASQAQQAAQGAVQQGQQAVQQAQQQAQQAANQAQQAAQQAQAQVTQAAAQAQQAAQGAAQQAQQAAQQAQQAAQGAQSAAQNAMNAVKSPF